MGDQFYQCEDCEARYVGGFAPEQCFNCRSGKVLLMGETDQPRGRYRLIVAGQLTGVLRAPLYPPKPELHEGRPELLAACPYCNPGKKRKVA